MSTPWDHLLTVTVTVAEQNGIDNNAMPTYATAATKAARVERTNQIKINKDGNEQLAQHVVVTSTAIGLNARVWFPGDNTGDTTAARRPISVTQAQQPNGDTLYETYF